jgi:hypothetical protein
MNEDKEGGFIAKKHKRTSMVMDTFYILICQLHMHSYIFLNILNCILKMYIFV